MKKSLLVLLAFALLFVMAGCGHHHHHHHHQGQGIIDPEHLARPIHHDNRHPGKFEPILPRKKH